MKKSIKNISPITGEFKDRSLEQDFQLHIFKEFNSYSRKYILTFGFIFFLFIIPDYFLIQGKYQLTTIFLIRVLYLLITVLYYYHLPHLKLYLNLFSTIYEFVGIVCFWLLFFCDKHPNIFFYQQGLIIFILAIFLILPNRYLNKLLLSILLTIVSLYIISTVRKLISLSLYSGGLFTFSITIMLSCAIVTRYENRLQRIQFLNNQALERMSNTDTLTAALTRRRYDLDLKKEIALAERYGMPFSGLMLDLDNFKDINDKYGHLEGDRVLVQLCSQIREMIRENDRLYRWGGEEFIIILPNSDLKSTHYLAERIQDYLQMVSFFPVNRVSCSIGITTWQIKDTPNIFTDRLDQLLYQAKKEGKGCVVTNLSDKILGSSQGKM